MSDDGLDGVRRALAEAADAPLVAAVSGGRDSMVLLHLLRFDPALTGLEVVVAHFDHAWRPESAGDALWLRGVCRAWGPPVHTVRAPTPPADEEEARVARYAFLHRVREETGARWLLTAHHAEDQAETVLYRALRGTGTRGLGGMHERRAPGVWRPLLGVRRETLARYAARWRVPWREDPTNRTPRPRAVLRHELLPRAAEAVAPDPVAALQGLARRARLDEAAWASLLPGLVEGLDPTWEGGTVALDRPAFLTLHPGVRVRVLRHLARRLGRPLGAAGTRAAMEFTSGGASGREVVVAEGLRLERALDRLVLHRRAPEVREGAEPLVVSAPREGSGDVRVGPARYRVRWGPALTARWTTAFDAHDLSFPLSVRGWEPGDRIRLSYGSKKLKKLFLEARIPLSRRHRLPVVADGAGRVLWIPGVARSVHAPPVADRPALTLGIDRADTD